MSVSQYTPKNELSGQPGSRNLQPDFFRHDRFKHRIFRYPTVFLHRVCGSPIVNAENAERFNPLAEPDLLLDYHHGYVNRFLPAQTNLTASDAVGSLIASIIIPPDIGCDVTNLGPGGSHLCIFGQIMSLHAFSGMPPVLSAFQRHAHGSAPLLSAGYSEASYCCLPRNGRRWIPDFPDFSPDHPQRRDKTSPVLWKNSPRWDTTPDPSLPPVPPGSQILVAAGERPLTKLCLITLLAVFLYLFLVLQRAGTTLHSCSLVSPASLPHQRTSGLQTEMQASGRRRLITS